MRQFKNPDKPVQLVKHFDEVPAAKKQWPMLGETKYDGVYCAVVVEVDGVISFLSRTGKEFFHGLRNPSFLAQIQHYIKHSNQGGFVLITELVNDQCSLEELSGLVNPNRVQNWTETEVHTMLYARCVPHDLIPIDDFFAGRCNIPFEERTKALRTLLPDHICAFQFEACTENNATTWFNAVVADGGEGIVLKQPKAPWVAGHKGWHMMKMVRECSYDLKCLGWKLGKGKRQNQIAALTFMFNDRLFEADLGKGWTDEKRNALTENRHSLVGKIFKVKALQISSKGVLRLPKVEEERIDKTESD